MSLSQNNGKTSELFLNPCHSPHHKLRSTHKSSGIRPKPRKLYKPNLASPETPSRQLLLAAARDGSSLQGPDCTGHSFTVYGVYNVALKYLKTSQNIPVEAKYGIFQKSVNLECCPHRNWVDSTASYVHMRMYICTYIQIYIYTHTRIYIYIHIYSSIHGVV